MSARLAHICPTCRRIVPARQSCARCAPTEAERLEAQPFRRAYRDPAYRRNRLQRYELAGGRCESCGVELKGRIHPDGEPWQSDHHVPASAFLALPELASAVENLRVYCTTRPGRRGCHAGARKPAS